MHPCTLVAALGCFVMVVANITSLHILDSFPYAYNFAVFNFRACNNVSLHLNQPLVAYSLPPLWCWCLPLRFCCWLALVAY